MNKKCPCASCIVLPICRGKRLGRMIQDCKPIIEYLHQVKTRRESISIYHQFRKATGLKFRTSNIVLADGEVIATTIKSEDGICRVIYAPQYPLLEDGESPIVIFKKKVKHDTK